MQIINHRYNRKDIQRVNNAKILTAVRSHSFFLSPFCQNVADVDGEHNADLARVCVCVWLCKALQLACLKTRS